MKRSLIFVYGVLSYAFFFATFLYAIGFIGNIAVPKSIDSAPGLPLMPSLLIDFGLLALFAIQHSGMARPAFKRWVTRFIPSEAERSTYVLLSSICLALLFWLWAPLGGVVWKVTSAWGQGTLYGLYFSSWALLLYATFLINHFDLFGLRQVFHALRGTDMPALEFATPALYRLVRHPIYVGWLGIMWFTPTMSGTHLVFAVISTLYILAGIRFEEKDLVDMHPEYAQYRQKVPALIPSFSRRLNAKTEMQSV
ncbi:MAG: isoprenylcysteine carboxylmethyltransferase family protein [Gammaproteobacteria bacterium]|nr:isoprenylcysteine carboxylmethyltransferase family protein [Gammaproteobacteria bacterium]MDH4313340.1 isoprenylcysteine carboxylmethyltransferase family protein [Gammaproteobacteria bacterium]MDH5214015.1 isoprenylcysteine carboxylmethyltransferase family protein [Gammaproteobacteria bacterium]